MISKKKKNEYGGMLLKESVIATTLLTIVLDLYGTEALDWEQYTLEQELIEDLDIKEKALPQINRDKLQSLISTLVTDLPYRDYLAFNYVSEALNNDPIDQDILDPVTPQQMMWAINEILLNQDVNDMPEFSDEVRRYMGAILRYYGLHKPVDVLKIAIMDSIEEDPDSVADPEFVQAAQSNQMDSEGYLYAYLAAKLQQLRSELAALTTLEKSSDWPQFEALIAKRIDKALRYADVDYRTFTSV